MLSQVLATPIVFRFRDEDPPGVSGDDFEIMVVFHQLKARDDNRIRTIRPGKDQAIQQFGVDHGRNPKDLNELVELKYIPKLPQPPYGTKFVYDANTGVVKIEKE